ncbi:hypothetical protein Y032_1044g3480 [Ancylostoma ceylanicum]|uniref:Uncharacterized protein n=1 Tax=Ancylostoma ceylanicum TaxID=53326 RepID=A0A016W7B0_9BILA|nr:hypothetical protein Y032_1044g3480 [Ancylostoma ceylanicum]
MPGTVPRGRLQGCLRWLWSWPQLIVVQLEASPRRQQSPTRLKTTTPAANLRNDFSHQPPRRPINSAASLLRRRHEPPPPLASTLFYSQPAMQPETAKKHC